MTSLKLTPTPAPCPICGIARGALWIPQAKVLDFGVPTLPPFDPDLSIPHRCQPCHDLHRLADPAYRALCGPMAAVWEQEALAKGGVRS